MRRNPQTHRHEPDRVDQASYRTPHFNDHHRDFEEIAVPHMDFLRNRALYLTRDADDAEDLLQETYFKAYRFWDKFEKGTNILGWLTQIMKNSYINNYRKDVKSPKTIEFDEAISHDRSVDQLPAASHHVMAENAGDIFEDEIASSIESLPSTFRTVVMLSDLQGFTYDEIASTISVPIGTVRSRLHRGRKMLREKLHTYAKSNGYLL
jgi:RNA polymerase sigma-70 factor, ECF subfamily